MYNASPGLRRDSIFIRSSCTSSSSHLYILTSQPISTRPPLHIPCGSVVKIPPGRTYTSRVSSITQCTQPHTKNQTLAISSPPIHHSPQPRTQRHLPNHIKAPLHRSWRIAPKHFFPPRLSLPHLNHPGALYGWPSASHSHTITRHGRRRAERAFRRSEGGVGVDFSRCWCVGRRIRMRVPVYGAGVEGLQWS